jgi:hypothetical protein
VVGAPALSAFKKAVLDKVGQAFLVWAFVARARGNAQPQVRHWSFYRFMHHPQPVA